MKYLKSIDFAAQSILWLLLLGGSLMILLSGENLGTIIYIGLICQFFLGCWQITSSGLLLLLKAEFFLLRKRHFTGALLNLLFLGSVAFLNSVANVHTIFSEAALFIFGIVTPWTLAIFYYSITWRWMFPKRHTGKFLSHISF